MARWTALAALLLLPFPAVLLAGCADSCDPGPPVTARGLVSGATSGGPGGFALDLRITDGPGGAGLPGAGVVVYWADTSSTAWEGGPLVQVDAQPGGASVVVDPGVEARTVEAKTTVRLVTDSEGRVRANVPSNRIVGVVAAKEGHTEEWVPALATGDDGGSGTVEVPLFREALALDMEAVWQGPAGGSSGAITNSQYAWDPHVVPFGESDEANRGYAARIVEMTVTVTWSNEATGFGDLGVGVGHEDPETAYFQDGSQNVAAGEQSETATLALAELMERGILGAPAVRAGAASDTGFVAPFGLPYRMHVEARFDREMAERATACGTVRGQSSDGDGYGASTPGFEWAAGAGALALVALAARRRERL